MLFQPSNILPDIINGVGNGTIDATDGLTVSWQINGNSQMNAYKIDICQNNTASTQIYTTGKITSNEDSNLPADPVDPQGNIQRFTAQTIASETLSSNGITNGNQYKIKITQYYGSNSSIVQRSMSVFRTRKKPTLSLKVSNVNMSNGMTIDQRECTFDGTYTQAQGDAIAWARWQLYNNSEESNKTSTYEKNLIYDSGKMYGVTTLQYFYDAFLNSKIYYLVLSVETENGIDVTKGTWFKTNWAEKVIAGTSQYSNVARLNNQSTGLVVEWGGIDYTRGNTSGTVVVGNSGIAGLDSNGSIYWREKVGSSSLGIESPWVFLMETSISRGYDATDIINLIDTSNNSIAKVDYDTDTRAITYTAQGSNSGTITTVNTEVLKIVIVPATTSPAHSARLIIRREGEAGRLVPYNDGYHPSYIYYSTADSPIINTGQAYPSGDTWSSMAITASCSNYKMLNNTWVAVDLPYRSNTEWWTLNVNSTGARKITKNGDVFVPTTKSFIVRYSSTYDSYEYLFPWNTGDTGNEGLYPSANLTPMAENIPYVMIHEYELQNFSQPEIAEIDVNGKQTIYYIQLIQGSNYVTDDFVETVIAENIESNSYNPEWNSYDGYVFYTPFNNGTPDSTNLDIDGTQIEGWAIYRVDRQKGISLHLEDASISDNYIYDFGAGSGQGQYRYWIYPIGEKRYITAGVQTRWIDPYFENWAVIEATLTEKGYYKVLNEFVFGKNLNSGGIGNNNSPTVSKNFTRYATVQMDNANYQSGTLSGLIGHIGYIPYIVQEGDTLREISYRYRTTIEQIVADNDNLESEGALTVGMMIKIFATNGLTSYYDDKQLRDALWNLSTTKNHLFLKSRKGDVIEIRTAGDISMQIQDNSALQPITISLPWVQVGDASKLSIIGGIV